MKKIIIFLLVFFISNIALATGKFIGFQKDIVEIYKIQNPIERIKKIKEKTKNISDINEKNKFLADINLYNLNGGVPNLKGIFFTSDLFNSVKGDKIVKYAIAKGINALVIDGEIYGKLAYDEAKGNLNPNQIGFLNEIKNRINFTKNNGIFLIARIETLKNVGVAKKYPLKTKNDNAYDGVWVDGSSDDVINYYKNIALGLALLGFNEFQLDYIRFPTERLDIQKEQSGERRINIITNFVRKMGEETKKLGLKLSIDTFGIVAWNTQADTESIGQNLKKLINYIDYIYPMIYPSHFGEGFGGFNDHSNPYLMINVANKKLLKLLGDNNIGKIRPWLQGFNYRSPNYGSQYIEKQINACKDLGIGSYLLWTPGSGYNQSIEAIYNTN